MQRARRNEMNPDNDVEGFSDMNLNPDQIKAARTRLGWTVADLARRAAISECAAQSTEAGKVLHDASLARVRAAIQAAAGPGEAKNHHPVTPAGVAEVKRDPFDG
jgi:ribosome-binding protein aMBF1 (putative translation factor)